MPDLERINKKFLEETSEEIQRGIQEVILVEILYRKQECIPKKILYSKKSSGQIVMKNHLVSDFRYLHLFYMIYITVTRDVPFRKENMSYDSCTKSFPMRRNAVMLHLAPCHTRSLLLLKQVCMRCEMTHLDFRFICKSLKIFNMPKNNF